MSWNPGHVGPTAFEDMCEALDHEGRPRRSLQSILAERRQNVLEMSRETCPIARAMLQHHIDCIDRELDDARKEQP